MLEFVKRLGVVIKACVEMVILAIVLTLVLSVITGLVIMLPIYLLEFIIGDLAGWWIFIVLVGLIITAEWEFLVSKFKWLFIEPFSKKSKIK